RLVSRARKRRTKMNVMTEMATTNHHGETPNAFGMVVKPVSQLFIQVSNPRSAPYFMAAADRAYIAKAIHEPTKPSADRYQVPEAQSPARIIPSPNKKPPTITAAGAKVV